MPGQYRNRSSTTGDMRVFNTMKYTLYYTTYRDKRAPNIVSTSSKSLANRTTITTEVTDFSGVSRVAIAYTLSDGQWRVTEMSRTSQNTNFWTVGLPFAMPNNLEYFIQAVDSAGNVASADNKGDYYPIRFTAWLYLPIVNKS
jgi:hypothetical protein